MKKIILSCAITIICSISIAYTQISGNFTDWKENKQNFHLPNVPDKSLQKPTQQASKITDADMVYTLPVVVHVITTGDAIGSPDNPTNANINKMLKMLNKAFAKKGPGYGGTAMNIQFQLAVRSPSNKITKGIVRVNGSGIANYVSGGITNLPQYYPNSADEVQVKGLNRWPNTDYINIWIVNKINGSSTAPGGYTYFPEYNSALIDGLVLQASVVNGTNKTIVHEMGHFFSLYHTFYDGAYETTCASNADCSQDGDKVCDTEPMLNVACSTSTNSCNNNQPFLVADVKKKYTVLNNFMSYTDCQWMFTAGQKDRARSALLNFRNGLITSKALTPADGTFPKKACNPTAVNGLSPYYGIQKVQFNSLNVYSNTSSGDASFYVDRTCNQSTTVTQGLSYTITITGSYNNPHRIKVFIDYNNDGDFNDTNETLLSEYTDVASKNVTIPVSGVVTGIPLRMRVVADNPALPAPTACKLNGTSTDGAGQIEDYAVTVLPAAFASVQSKKQLSSHSHNLIVAKQ